MRSRRSSLALALGVIGLALLAACNSSLLPPATFTNVVDTVTLYALNGTALGTPSAYSIIGRLLVRTETSVAFDFAFNFDSLGQPVLLPIGAIGLSGSNPLAEPGFQVSSATFDAIDLAPVDGYVVDKPFVVAGGTVALARSRSETCSDGSIFSLYAKLQVLAVDPTARTIQFQILSDQNCSHIGLAPGLPEK